MTITIDETAVKRVQELRSEQGRDNLMLRITVDSGGCSGFLYDMDLTEEKNDDDHVYEGCVVTDDMSVPFLAGSVVSFDKGLIGSEFKIDNPNAVSGCGCGTSFALKS